MNNTILNPDGTITKKPNLLQKMMTNQFWQQQNVWLTFLTILLLLTVIVYLSVHSMEKYDPAQKGQYYDDPHEAEFKKMDAEDVKHITSLINEGSANIPTPEQINSTAVGQDSGAITVSTPVGTTVRFSANPNNQTVKSFILEQLPYVYPQDTANIFSSLDQQPNSLAINYIQNARFRVKSYFWLAGPHTYFEIIFWTIFGVLTSILFYIAMAIANGTGFKPAETPGHLAKIAYSPFISLIIIFSYNYLSNPDSIVDVQASKGTLIISFLLGFYSSRAMKLLDKLKDIFLPYGDDSNKNNNEAAAPAALPPSGPEGSPVTVDINLNDPSHPDAEELNAQIAQTVVTLSPQNGGAPIPLTKTGDDELEGIFTAANVPDGAYTITAHLSTNDGSNYNGTQEIQVTSGDNNYTLALTKADVSG